ncbi:MAG TPA: ubiquitin [Clostridiales bacterium UBA8153]|nr:ubiquitin [Clostridiales bacterium UBA8153]
MEISLEKIDVIRERTGIGYREARALLEASGGDVVGALIAHEGSQAERTWRERIHVSGGELASKVRELLHQGNVTNIVVKQGEETILQFPVTIGALGTLVAPWLAVLGAVGALVTRSTIEVERRGVAPPGAGAGSQDPG